MRKITPFLWFDDQAEEAAKFYVSLFKDSQIKAMTRYTAEATTVSGMPEGTVMTVAFELLGQDFIALNGGPVFKFTEAVSFVVNCTSQSEVDELWEKLSEGGSKGQCGWLKDTYGLSWQVVPMLLGKLLGDPDSEKSRRVMEAMLRMTKLDSIKLQEAYDGV